MISPLAAAALTIILLRLLPTTSSLGSASTLAIIDSTTAVCGILASTNPASIQCTTPAGLLPLLPNASFDSISAGQNFLCGLRSGGRSLICWNSGSSNTTNLSRRRLYSGVLALTSVSVGIDQVAAISNTGLTFWRGFSGGFPNFVSGSFHSLTSGSGFSCAITNFTVRCWGVGGATIQRSFANISMTSITAGGSHACGLDVKGLLICKGSNSSGQLDAPAGPAFSFSSLALGAAHSCAIRTPNGTVVCWGGVGGGRGRTPGNEIAFVFLVAGSNLTCGLTEVNYTVVCWRPDGSNLAAAPLLPRILPGICAANATSCRCGVFPDSGSLCAESGVICAQCGGERDTSPSPEPTVARRRRSKWFLPSVIVGSIGAFSGLCTILFWLWRGVCRQKRVHNTVLPTITAAAAPAGDGGSSVSRSGGSPGVPTLFTSRSSRVFRRQGSSMMKRQRSGPSRVISLTNLSSLSSFKSEPFTFSELAAATKDFAFENKIGSGSFGTVYRGKLADGREVAIKRSENGTRTKKYQEKESAFQSELAFLTRLHHKHLVGLVGFCEEREERLLVYEYMKNGALYDHLHPGSGSAAPELSSWKMRIKLLLDAARGVEYLHNYAVPPIIHRDIKSSNILIDAVWVARVSDFGLSLIGPETGGEEHLSMKAAGTVGYMDPEYYGLQQLTAKSDVYGLGVVMLEVLTGKRAIFKEEAGSGPESVVDYAVPSIVSGGMGQVLDPRVGAPGANEADAVELLAYTAVRCVSLEGRERPSMSDVVDNLESALALCEDSPDRISSDSFRSMD